MWPFRKKKLDEVLLGIHRPEVIASIPCATANIRLEIPYGEDGHEVRNGTKHFRGGAKVYIIDTFPGECENVTVIGHHRKNGRYIKLVIGAKKLENFRVTIVYSPKVIAMLKEHYSVRNYRSGDAEQICLAASNWAH